MLRLLRYVVTAGVAPGPGYSVSVLNLSNGKPAWSSFACDRGGSLPLVVGRLVMSYGCDSQGNDTIEAVPGHRGGGLESDRQLAVAER